MPFTDRVQAGRRLAEAVRVLSAENPVVVGLPRGGVQVAYEVARALRAPLDVIVVRKLGVPFQPELAMGAVGEGGVRVVDESVVRLTGVPPAELAKVEERERSEVERRASRFRSQKSPVPLAGRTVVVVDDGVATGSTARAACQIARAQGATRVVLAVPVGPPDVRQSVSGDVDEVICLETPARLHSIGAHYRDFRQITDDEVVALLRRSSGGSDDLLEEDTVEKDTVEKDTVEDDTVEKDTVEDDPTVDDLREEVRSLDAEIARLRGTPSGEMGAGVRDPEEIASDLIVREEQQAVLHVLERRRETIRERLRRLEESANGPALPGSDATFASTQ